MITDEILDRAVSHYKSVLAKPLHFIDVPEWVDGDGKPTRIYFRNENNLLMDQEVAALQSKGKHGEAAALALIQRARFEDGSKMFKPLHAKQLARSASSEVIVRIIDEMARINQENALSDEDLEKN